MAGEEFLKFNNGQKFSFSNFKEIREEDLKNADAETKRLFNIFAGDDHILQANEAQSLWNKIQTAASSNKKGDNSVFDNEEIQNFLDTDADIKANSSNTQFSINALTNIVSQIFVTKESQTNTPSQKATAEQVAKACKETVISIIDDNISEAEEIFSSQNLGSISGAYDDKKKDDNKLKTSNVRKVLDYQKAGKIQIIEAKNGNLTKRAYYEENKQRIKDMILTRLTVLESSTGVSFLDQYKGKYTKEQLEQIISDYVDTICNNVEMDKLKEMQKQFVSFSAVEEISALDNFVNNAVDYSENRSEIKLDTMGGEGKPITIKNPKGIIPSYWDSAEPITFEEVYKTERGVEYSQYKVEQYVLAKKEMETVANAYNKKQQFVDTARTIVDNKELSVDEKLQQIMTLYSEFYALCDDDGLGELQKIIDSSNTLIKLNENGLDLSAYQNNEQMKQSALNKLLKTAISQKEADFEKFLGGKTIEEYQEAFERAAKDILGEDNAKMLSEAMKNDNMTVIQRWTGNASMAGMGMTVVGGILCFTPLAPLGGVLVTVGNTLAIGGMVAKTGLGVADYATKDVQTTEELTDLAKDFVMDAGGFIVGMGAGKAGMKAFSKLIDKKLAAVFAKEITAGNRMQALKTVLKNPEQLKNFMSAAGAKISTDFLISYVGDLAMMGLLDTDDDWRSLLQANLTGILVGMSGDVKDLAGVGKSAARGKTRATSGTTTGKPMTQQDYAMSVLGKEVTVKDPATGAKVEGSVTKVSTENGEVKVEVNGKEYSTNEVISVKSEFVDDLLLTTDIDKFKQWLSDENVTFLTQPGIIDGYETFHFEKNNITYKVYCEDGQIKVFLADEGNDSFKYYKIENNKDLIEADRKIDNNIPNCDVATLENILRKQGIEVKVYKNYTYNDGFINYTKDNVEYYLNYFDGKIIAGRACIPEENEAVKRYEINDDGNFIEITKDKYSRVLSDAYFQHLKTENPDTYNTIIGFEKALKTKTSVFELKEYFDKMGLTNLGRGFFFQYEGKTYNIIPDKSGNVIGLWIRDDHTITYDYFTYDKNGQAIQSSIDEYNKLTSDLFDPKESNIISIYKLGLKKELIQNIIEHGNMEADVPRFNGLFIKDVTALIKTPEDEKLFYFLISNKTTLSKKGINKYTFNSQEILNIMKSPQAKNVINEKIANNKPIGRDDIKKIDKDLLTSTSSYKRSDKRELSYKIQDWDEDPMLLMMVYDQHVDLFNSKVPPGEVICARGQLLCNTGSKLVPINLTKEKFMELFPIKDRFNINQNGLGDCWLVTTFGALMDSPKGRAAIYSMFRQDGNDIYIKFPDEDVELGFKNGNVNTLMPFSIYIDDKKLKIGTGDAEVKASKGIRLLERAYSVHRHDGYQENVTTQMVTDIFFMNKQMQRLEGGYSTNAIKAIVGKDKVKTTSYSEPDEIIKQLEENINDPNKIVTFNTKEKGEKSSYDLYGNHAYHIVDYNKETGMISISNPWHNNKIQEIPVYEWLNYISNFKISELK